MYGAAAPGRIDMIDGQYRFEVARNILDHGSVQIGDLHLGGSVPGVLGEYSPYGISGSLVGLPLVLISRALGPYSIDRDQFFFSFTSTVFGAATAALLFLFYAELGIDRIRALGWTFVAAFATLYFPGSITVFDQAQHAFFILAACYAAYAGARRDSMALMALGGAALAVLVNFQETYAIVFPTVAIAALGNMGASPAERRRAFERIAVFLFVAGLGILAWAGFNSFRFGSLLFSGKGVNHPSPLGNPLIGIPGLLVSPGKSIFLYSPAVIVALAGLRPLLRRDLALGAAVIGTVLIHFLMISTLSFYGGDWCWGPRYFVATLPMLALDFPFATANATAVRRTAYGAIIALSFVVQLLGVSLDHHRFFYARSLPAFFWATNGTFYFHESALLARPGEILDSIRDGVPDEVIAFRPGPNPDQLTYAVFGGWNGRGTTFHQWMRRYSVFWLPRPWPLWMRTIPSDRHPVNLRVGLILLAALGLGGAAAIGAGLRGARAPERQHAN